VVSQALNTTRPVKECDVQDIYGQEHVKRGEVGQVLSCPTPPAPAAKLEAVGDPFEMILP
jgi:hypothetical protein